MNASQTTDVGKQHRTPNGHVVFLFVSCLNLMNSGDCHVLVLCCFVSSLECRLQWMSHASCTSVCMMSVSIAFCHILPLSIRQLFHLNHAKTLYDDVSKVALEFLPFPLRFLLCASGNTHKKQVDGIPPIENKGKNTVSFEALI